MGERGREGGREGEREREGREAGREGGRERRERDSDKYTKYVQKLPMTLQKPGKTMCSERERERFLYLKNLNSHFEE